jgi:hypothetical protein
VRQHADLHLQRSFEIGGSSQGVGDQRDVLVDSFSSLLRAPLDSVSQGQIDQQSSPLQQPHTSFFVPSSDRVLPTLQVKDEQGRIILWPWEAGAKPQPNFINSRPARERHSLDTAVNKALDMASADGQRGRKHTGVKAWHAFCEDTMGQQAARPLDPNEPLHVKLEEEWLAMRFVCALIEVRGVAVETARVYFASVQGWHAREYGVKLAGGLKLERLPQMLKGLRRIHGSKPRALRRAISPHMLKKAMDLVLNPNDPLHANVRAAFTTALAGLLRSDEYTTTEPSLMLLRSDIVQLTKQQMVIMIHPCKNMHHLGGKTCPLVIGAGGADAYACSVAEVTNMLAVDPHPDSGYTPMFRDPRTNKPLSYKYMLDMTRHLMRSIGEDPSQFGTQSYRIGGASVLFAAGASDTVIRTMGRWSSDLYRLYVRACFEQCVYWTSLASKTKMTDVQGEFDEVDFY